MIPVLENFLLQLKNSFSKLEIVRLKSLGNEALHAATLENNKLLAKIALISYSLHKLSTKEHIVMNKNWTSARKAILRNLEKALNAAKQKDLENVEKQLGLVIEDVVGIDRDLGYFLTNLFDKAKIKLASRAYAFGTSLGQAAELTGANKEQLQRYIANTVIHEEKMPEMGIAKRLEQLKKKMGAGKE